MGRHEGLQINEQICKNYFLGLIEDEIRSLLACSTYSNISHEVNSLTIDLQFQETMKCQNEHMIAAWAFFFAVSQISSLPSSCGIPLHMGWDFRKIFTESSAIEQLVFYFAKKRGVRPL